MKKLFSIALLLFLVATASATVVNWGGNTFTGLHLDSKPTATTGSRFFETDMPYGAYVRSNGTWTLISGASVTVPTLLSDLGTDATSTHVTTSQVANFHAPHSDDQDLSSYALSTHNHSGVYEPANANIQSHISSTNNPHATTFSQVTGSVNLATQASGSLPDANITSASTWNAKQNALTYPVTGVASPTTNYLTKWSGANTLANAFKYGTLTDAKWCSYTTASGLECTQNAPAGSGDVIGGSSSANGELVVYSGTGGKTIKQSGLGTGILRLGASAVPSVGNVNLASEVTGSLPDTSLSFTNNTTGNASTSAHGYAPKGTAGTTQYWRQDWTLGTPGGGSSNYVQVSSVTTAATTSLVNITGLSWSLAANTPFSFLCGIIMSNATTTAGPRVSLTGPASPTHFSVSTSFLNTVTTLATANTITAYGGLTATCTTSCDNVSKRVMTINGAGLNGSNAGTIQLQVQSSATGTVTVHEGSYCTYW